MVAGPELKARVSGEVGKAVVGRELETELLLVSLLAGGHVLLEGVPGVSKTLLARSFSRCLGLGFGRVQFTPDMLPLDILGGFVFNLKDRDFEFRKGPVFTNILLADEINRAPPKVQSALLEAMQEQQITVEGHTEKLPSPHMVIATQNPVEFQGVYPLPEGQLDRFMLKVVMGYQPSDDEVEILRRNMSGLDAMSIAKVVSNQELLEAMSRVGDVRISGEMLEYLARLGRETREDARVSLGASPRAVVHLTLSSRAMAYLSGREYVVPDDVKGMAPYVMPHRLKLDQGAVLKGGVADSSQVIRDVLDRVTPPR